MIPKDLDNIDEKDLAALVENGVRESRQIEFKATLSVAKDGDKKEFLADISAMANASGGDVIFGIEESSGVASGVVGLEGYDPDADGLSVEQIILNGIEPRIIGLRLKPVSITGGKWGLVIRVPNSMNRPHMVVYKGSSRFFSRNSGGKYPLDVHEIRSAFLASESLSEKVRNYRLERTDAILKNDTPRKLSGSHRICLHLIPLSSFGHSGGIDINAADASTSRPWPMCSSSCSSALNYDGLLVYEGGNREESQSYTQVFRSGIIESVESDLLRHPDENVKTIPSIAYEEKIITHFGSCLRFLKEMEVSAPLVACLSLLNVKGYSMTTGGIFPSTRARPIDRTHLILPELLCESFDVDVASFLKAWFDQIWNACGWSGSQNFDESGQWVSR